VRQRGAGLEQDGREARKKKMHEEERRRVKAGRWLGTGDRGKTKKKRRKMACRFIKRLFNLVESDGVLVTHHPHPG